MDVVLFFQKGERSPPTHSCSMLISSSAGKFYELVRCRSSLVLVLLLIMGFLACCSMVCHARHHLASLHALAYVLRYHQRMML